MRALLAITPLLLTGCLAPLGELRTMPPARQLELSGRYDVLGGCVADGIQTGPTHLGGLQILRREELLTMTVTAFTSEQVPLFDLTFRQQGDQVRVEERHDDRHVPRWASAQAWTVVERCAGRAGAK